MIVSARAGINGDWLKTKKRFLVLQGMRGRQLMAEPEVEAAWRAEFKRSGATQLRETPNNGGGSADELKEHAAFRWLGDEAEERRLQLEKTYHYGRWTMLVAVAAVIASLIAVGLAQLR